MINYLENIFPFPVSHRQPETYSFSDIPPTANIKVHFSGTIQNGRHALASFSRNICNCFIQSYLSAMWSWYPWWSEKTEKYWH